MPPACRPGVNRALLCIVLFSALCSGLHQYQLVDEPKTWGEAQQYCREKFTDLATVNNMEDVDQLKAAAGSGFSGKVWIGLYDNSSSWAWSTTDDGYYGTNNEPFLQWSSGKPDRPRLYNTFCGLFKNGLLLDYPCTFKSNFICYDRSDASSPPKYIFVFGSKTFKQAQTICKHLYTDLASIRNEEESTRIQQAIQTDEAAFVGLVREAWPSWSDGTKRKFKNWLPRRPWANTGDCATSLIGGADAGKWVEDHCNQTLPFMCHYEKKQQFRIKLRALKPTVDLNDPAVTEAILNLLEKKMKEKGITAGFKLRWVKKPDNTVFQEEKDEL